MARSRYCARRGAAATARATARPKRWIERFFMVSSCGRVERLFPILPPAGFDVKPSSSSAPSVQMCRWITRREEGEGGVLRCTARLDDGVEERTEARSLASVDDDYRSSVRVIVRRGGDVLLQLRARGWGVEARLQGRPRHEGRRDFEDVFPR